MKQVILVAEMKGFAKMATALAMRVEEIGITPERVRSAARTLIKNAITAATSVSQITPLEAKRIGGDTWYFTFASTQEGALFGSVFLAAVLDIVMTGGVYYLKPSLAMNYGHPRLSGDSFLDDESIAAYRMADSGEPFRLVILPAAEAEVRSIAPTLLSSVQSGDEQVTILDWRKFAHGRVEPNSAAAGLHISSLLTDNDVVHFSTNADVLRQVIREQDSASLVRVFGGAMPCEDPDYTEYTRAAIRIVQSHKAECVVQNYFTPYPSISNYVWLRTCGRLVRQHPKHFAYSAFMLPDDAVRPIAFHLYDEVVMLFLRRYNEMRDTVSMAGSILVRNAQLAQRLREHFVEGVKTAGRFNQAEFDEFESRFSFPRHVINAGDVLIEELFRQ
jgi:hypothetical protein